MCANGFARTCVSPVSRLLVRQTVFNSRSILSHVFHTNSCVCVRWHFIFFCHPHQRHPSYVLIWDQNPLDTCYLRERILCCKLMGINERKSTAEPVIEGNETRSATRWRPRSQHWGANASSSNGKFIYSIIYLCVLCVFGVTVVLGGKVGWRALARSTNTSSNYKSLVYFWQN